MTILDFFGNFFKLYEIIRFNCSKHIITHHTNESLRNCSRTNEELIDVLKLFKEALNGNIKITESVLLMKLI